jgi:predicted short-subunit dehydrogenase-like oxidoreductase (DUF2520 family)
MQRMKLSIIGTGNVAHQLGSLLANAGIRFSDVYGRSTEKALDLAFKLKCNVVDSVSKLTGDLIIVCVTDNAIPEILALLPSDKKAVYTSGSLHLKNCGRTYRTGVLYPLQTLKKEQTIGTSDLPILIEAQDQELLKEIEDVARIISNNVHLVNSDDRLYYHLSAVWMNNFTTHLVYLSQKILKNKQLNSDLLRPLLLETVEKLKRYDPRTIQTGPARRGDERILALHRDILNERQRDIYELISESIQDTYLNDDQL